MRSVVDFWRNETPPPQAFMDAESASGLSTVDDSIMLSDVISRIRRWLSAMSAWQRSMWIDRILEQTGVDLRGLPGDHLDDPAVLATLGWIEALVADVSRQAKTRMIADAAKARSLGLTGRAVAAMVGAGLDVVQSRADLIATDMTSKFYGNFNRALQEEAGLDKYKWNHSFRPNPRRHHVERQGNIYRWDQPPYDGHPGHAVNCRCTAEPVI